MTTEFGKELRKLRIDRDETLTTMAKKMGISISYLSAIETGTRSVPDGFLDKLVQRYDLNKEMENVFSVALEHSLNSLDISLANALPLQRDLAVMLARKLPELSTEECEKLLAVLKENA